METPIGLRGRYYPSSRTARCPGFNKCIIDACGGCNNYNPYDIACLTCEENKPPAARCHHTDDIQTAYKIITEKTKMPMMHPDKVNMSSNDSFFSVGFDSEWDKTLNQLHGAVSDITVEK